MYPVIDDVCTKMTKYIHQEIKKQHPDGLDAKEVQKPLQWNRVYTIPIICNDNVDLI